MNSKNIVIIIIASVLSGLILLALGVLIGRSLQQPRFFVTEAVGEFSGDQQLLELGNTLEVKGQIILPINPEVAIITLGVEVCNPDINKINQEVTSVMANLVEELGEAGLSEETVIPADFSIYNYSNEPCGTSKVAVFTDDLEQINNLISLATDAGANKIFGVDFTLKDMKTAKQEAIQLAFKDAEQQAQQITDSLDRTLGKVIKSKVDTYDTVLTYSSDYNGIWLAAPETSDYYLGPKFLRATVTLVYEIR